MTPRRRSYGVRGDGDGARSSLRSWTQASMKWAKACPGACDRALFSFSVASDVACAQPDLLGTEFPRRYTAGPSRLCGARADEHPVSPSAVTTASASQLILSR